MSCIHYKFKTTLDYRSISFDGVALSLADLKKAIFQQRRMKPGEIDLEITNAQTKEVYKNNDDMITKNSSVIVARVPIPTSTKNNTSKSWEAFKQECARAMKEEKEKERAAQELANQQAGEIASAKTSEIDKIRAMMNQSGRDFDPASYKNKVPLGQPPVGYKCYKCGKGGHYIHGCTEKSESNVIEPKFKRSTGIPNSFLTLTDDPTVPGALLTYSGKFAVPTIDKHAYATGKKELPPFMPGMNIQAVEPKSPGIPQELRCLICQDLLKDAVLIPCCGNSFCDDCIRNKLLETEDHECPVCHEQDVSPDKLIPNMLMRKAVINFLNESGYTNAINKSVERMKEERMKEERRSASPTMLPASTPPVQAPPVQAPPVQKPVQTQRPVNIRQAWQQYKKPTYNNQQVIQTLTPSQPNVIPRIVPVTQQIPSIQPAAHHLTNPISSVNRVLNDAVPVQTVTRSQPPPSHMTSIPVQSVDSPILSQHSERSNTPEDRAPTPVKDEQPNPPGVDEAAVNVISVVGQPPPEVQKVQAVQTTRSSTVPSWQNLKAPGSNTPPLYGSLPATTNNSHPPSLLGGPPPIFPGVPGPMIGQPITPMNFGMPPFGPGPRPPFPPFAPPVAPMSKEQFYREQKRMKEAVKEKKYDVMDHFTKDFLERKEPVKKTKSKSKSRSRSRSKTPRRSRSRTPRRLRSLTPRRSRSRSRPPRSLTPIRKRSRSRTPYRSRSRSPPPRLRTRSRSRSRYRSRSRSRFRSRSRSYARSLSRGRYRSYSRSPVRSYRRYSRSRSRSPYRRYSPVRRRSPIGSRRRSLTPSGSPSYRAKYPESRRWSPRPGARYGNDGPGIYSPPPRYPPDYGFSGPRGPQGPPPFGFDGPPPPHFFGNPPGYGIGPRPPICPPGMPVGLPPPPPPGFGMYPAPPVPPIRNRSRSPKRHGRPLMGTPPRGRYDHDRPRDRKDYGTDRTSDRPRTHDDKSRYQRDGYGRKDYPKTQDGVRSHDREKNSQTSDSGKTSKDKKGREDKENKENGKRLKSDEKTEKEKSKEKGDSKSKKKKESKKKEKSDKKKRDKSKDKKKVETDISGDVDKNEEKKDSTKVSTGNTYTRSSNSTLIFLTGGGDEAPEKSEAKTVACTAETTTDATNVKKDTKPSPAKEIKKIKKVKKRSKSSNVAEDTSDSTTENKSRTRSSKKAASLVEYNETSGDVSDKPPKRKGTSKKGKAKVKEEESKQEDEETPSKDTDGIQTKVEKESNESGNEVATLVNRAPPSPHDQFPSSPIGTTDGVHEDEPSPPGVNDKPDLLLDKPDLDKPDLLLDKPELMLDLPELSKWERDDIDEESEEEPQKIEVKKSLPKSVIEKAEKALTQKPPKISSVASAITSPGRNTTKKRRVYLDDEEEEKKPVESYEDNRRVHTKQKSMQITISSKDKQRNEELERREVRKGDKSRREEKRDREPERKSVFTRMKLDDHDRNSEKYKDRRDRESRSSLEDSSNRKDRESRKIKDLREKLPNRTDRRDHERFEEQRERHREKPSRKHSDSNHKDNDIGKGSSDKSRSVNSKSVKDRDDHNDKELNETRNTNEKTESKSKPVIDRKESLLDESLFEPDYNEEVSETETSSTDEAPGKVQKEKEPSPSASSHESSPTPAKKRKRHDTTDDENSSKKSKHKKHKHKHKTGKHKHKKKKHKKKEQETE